MCHGIENGRPRFASWTDRNMTLTCASHLSLSLTHTLSLTLTHTHTLLSPVDRESFCWMKISHTRMSPTGDFRHIERRERNELKVLSDRRKERERVCERVRERERERERDERHKSVSYFYRSNVRTWDAHFQYRDALDRNIGRFIKNIS